MAKLDDIGKESLNTVVELDSATNGSNRRDFFTKRFEAQGKHPEAFISIGALEAGKMVGFVFCHMLHGEFGDNELTAVLDAMAVEIRVGHDAVVHRAYQLALWFIVFTDALSAAQSVDDVRVALFDCFVGAIQNACVAKFAIVFDH